MLSAEGVKHESASLRRRGRGVSWLSLITVPSVEGDQFSVLHRCHLLTWASEPFPFRSPGKEMGIVLLGVWALRLGDKELHLF